MKKLAPLLALAIGLLALNLGAVWLRHEASEATRWRDIAAHVPTSPLNTSHTNALPNNGWLFGFVTGEYQVGHVVCGDGEVWRFAFASHHRFTGLNSYTVFKSQRGMIRVKGSGFCCEVEFDNQKQPAGTEAFVALLERQGDKVEILR